MVREPIVAGQFYPGEKDVLLKVLDGFFGSNKDTLDLKAAIMPHAGYTYSGKVAASLYSLFPKEIETAVIIGPNHTGLGSSYSFMKSGVWRTPLGEVEVDEEVAGEILSKADVLEEDSEAHRLEHSIEVQLPFLQYINSKVKIVPIILASPNQEKLELIADAIALVAKKGLKKIIVIASSDLTHYEEKYAAKEKDDRAIQAIVALDGKRLMEEVKQYSITMCGTSSCYVAVSYAKKVGALSGKLIEYKTSGEVSGDETSVVGYASIALI